MAKKTTRLLEKLKKKIEETKKLHEFEWDGLKLDCPHRKRRTGGPLEYGCKIMNESPANEKNYFYYCHFSNCRFT